MPDVYATITHADADVLESVAAAMEVSAADEQHQTCVQALAPAYVTDPWIARRLPSLVRAAGFAVGRVGSHGYVQVESPDYMLSVVARGADALAVSGQIGKPLAEALAAEARRRVEANAFFGHIAYLSLTATKPA